MYNIARKTPKLVNKTKHAIKRQNSCIHLKNPKQISRNIISLWKKWFTTIFLPSMGYKIDKKWSFTIKILYFIKGVYNQSNKNKIFT